MNSVLIILGVIVYYHVLPNPGPLPSDLSGHESFKPRYARSVATYVVMCVLVKIAFQNIIEHKVTDMSIDTY